MKRMAWMMFKLLPLRMKVAVVLTAPLWVPIALAAWLENGEGRL